MADTTQAPSRFGSPRDPEIDLSVDGANRPWSARTALFFWLAVSGLIWLALAAFATTIA